MEGLWVCLREAFHTEDIAIQHTNLVIISESKIHNMMQSICLKKLIHFLVKFGVCFTKICYISDGCASQYKNREKNFIKWKYSILTAWEEIGWEECNLCVLGIVLAIENIWFNNSASSSYSCSHTYLQLTFSIYESAN